jgi:hypothetical protein
MTIDLERLASDLDYWNEVAPEGASHLINGRKFCKWQNNVKFVSSADGDSQWTPSLISWNIEEYIEANAKVIIKPVLPVLMPDDCLAARIGEIGNQAHNLGCECQNDENLSEKISKIASCLWDLAKKATKEPAAPKTQPTDTQPAESGAQISAEWVNGLPPRGTICEVWHLKKEWREVEIVGHVMSHENNKAVWQMFNKRVWGADAACNFRPIRSQAEREREAVINAALDGCGYDKDCFAIAGSPESMDLLNELYDLGFLQLPTKMFPNKARGES